MFHSSAEVEIYMMQHLLEDLDPKMSSMRKRRRRRKKEKSILLMMKHPQVRKGVGQRLVMKK